MEKINPKDLTLKKIGQKSSIFVDGKGLEYNATPRVANDVLKGECAVYAEDVEFQGAPIGRWLMTPTCFN